MAALVLEDHATPGVHPSRIGHTEVSPTEAGPIRLGRVPFGVEPFFPACGDEPVGPRLEDEVDLQHALRVAVRLDPLQAPAAIEVMAKDANPTIRKVAAFESRYIRDKHVIQPLIELVADEERYVAISAVQSLWMLTRHETEFHDWEASSKQDRQNWMQEWTEWWNASKDSFELPPPQQRRRSG